MEALPLARLAAGNAALGAVDEADKQIREGIALRAAAPISLPDGAVSVRLRCLSAVLAKHETKQRSPGNAVNLNSASDLHGLDEAYAYSGLAAVVEERGEDEGNIDEDEEEECWQDDDGFWCTEQGWYDENADFLNHEEEAEEDNKEDKDEEEDDGCEEGDEERSGTGCTQMYFADRGFGFVSQRTGAKMCSST